MTRRTPTPRVDPDEFGFDLVGDEFNVQPQELMCLIGLDSLAAQLYFVCLRPFASHKSGDVREASYYRFIKLMTPRQSRTGGPRWPTPTKQQIRDALARLQDFGLVKLFLASSMREGALQIRVVRRFGVVSSDSVRPGVRTGYKTRGTRMDA